MSRTSVLTDAQWERIRPLLPSSDGKRGRPFRDDRPVVEGILYRYRCGIAWRDVPEQFGPWQTVWKRHRRYSGDGTWNKILAALLTDAQKVELIDWAVSVDSTINRAHQHAAGALKKSDRVRSQGPKARLIARSSGDPHRATALSGSQGRPALTTALAITSSLRATAVRITLAFLPRAARRSLKALIAGLKRTAERAAR